MATKSAGPKTTVNVGGVPYTAATAEKANALASKDTNSAAAPSRGQAGWIDPIRAAGDTKFTSQYGTPTAAQVQDASTGPQNTTDVANSAPPPTEPSQAPTSSTTPSLTQSNPQSAVDNTTASGGPTAPVNTTAAGTTPTQTKYQAGLQATQAAGTTPPADAGAARTAVASALPLQQPDTSNVDQYLSQDPVISKIMTGITDLLKSQNQVSSLMDDYNKLYKSSGLGDINKELIDADTVINGTEGDIRNEIQTAGGFGTESQVQAMTLARNKGLLTRYNQLVQMKTDATNQLNTMMQLDSQDKQMAQQQLQSNISNMFNLANFRQTALNHTQETFQNLVSTQGADNVYAMYKNDPAQMSKIENAMGMAPGGLAVAAQTAAQSRSLDIQSKQAQISASQASTANAYSNIAKNKFDMASTVQKAEQAKQQGAQSADNVLTAVKTAKNQAGIFSAGLAGTLTGFIGGSPAHNLGSTIETIKSNLAFSELQKMRDNSPTGGALGQVSEGEEKLLSSTVASLDPHQSPGQLQKNLDLVQQHYVSYLTSLGYGYDQASGNVITP